MKLNKQILKQIIKEELENFSEADIGSAAADLGGSAKVTGKNPAVQKFVEEVKVRLGKVTRTAQIEFLTSLMQALEIDPTMLTQVKTTVQKRQRDGQEDQPGDNK